LQSFEAANDTYKQTVLTAFQDVADRLAALDHDAQALDAASTSARTAQGVYEDTSARYKLGAVPWYAVRQSEQQWRNARLDEIRYRGTRLSDTAALFQAMGNPPVDPATLGSGRASNTAAAAPASPSDAAAAQSK
jgi:outer membrane protein TolC